MVTMTIILGGDRTIVGEERVVVNLETYRGDTNKPMVFSFDLGTLNSPIVTVAIALMQRETEAKRFISGRDITITSDLQFTLNSYVIEIDPGEYKYDVQITLTDGTILTPIYGTWKIRQDQTRP